MTSKRVTFRIVHNIFQTHRDNHMKTKKFLSFERDDTKFEYKDTQLLLNYIALKIKINYRLLLLT